MRDTFPNSLDLTKMRVKDILLFNVILILQFSLQTESEIIIFDSKLAEFVWFEEPDYKRHQYPMEWAHKPHEQHLSENKEDQAQSSDSESNQWRPDDEAFAEYFFLTQLS